MQHPKRICLGRNLSRRELGFQSPKSACERVLSSEEGHLITVAPTGMGKGRSVIIPTLLSYPGPVLVIDPKGEAAAICARRRRDFGEVVIIDPFKIVSETSDSLNPLDLRKISSDSVVEHALLISDLVQVDHTGFAREPFWDIRATALLSGALAYIMSARPEQERHLGILKDVLTNSDTIYGLATILDNERDKMDPFAYKEIAQLLQLPDNTRGGILATAQQHIYLFDDANVLEAVKTTSFDLAAFRRGDPMTIFLVLPPGKLSSHATLLRLWVATLLYALLERERLPELPNLFIIDEAAQLGTLSVLRTAMTLMRGYGMRCWTFWQDLSQLKHFYKQDWQTIINNAAVFQTFGVTTNLMAKELSEVTGELGPQQLLSLRADQQVILEPGGKITLAQKLDYLLDQTFEGLFDPHPMFGLQDARNV